MKKAKEPFDQFYVLKTHIHMQISYKPVVQACHDLKILMHSSKGEEINFKFLFIQFRFVRWNWVKQRNFHNSLDRFAYLENQLHVQIRLGMYQWCTKELSVVRGQAFLSSFKKILRLSSFHKLNGKWEWERLIMTMLFE